MFVILIIATVLILCTLIVVLTMIYQSKLINDYIIKVKFTNYQSITDAVAQLKKNDLQEIFRELQIAGEILEVALKNPSYISSSYITNAKANKLISSSDSAKTLKTPDPSKMSYYVEFGEMNYSILASYSPADKEVDYCGLIEYYLENLYPSQIIDIK